MHQFDSYDWDQQGHAQQHQRPYADGSPCASTDAGAYADTNAGAHTSTDASTDASIDAIAQPVSTPSAFDSGWAGTPKIADRPVHYFDSRGWDQQRHAQQHQHS